MRSAAPVYIALAVLASAPALYLRLRGAHLPSPVDAVLFGLAIVGAAFLLSWAAEVAQLDLSAGLTIALLAFITVLPEYAVDLVFAWKSGNAVQQYGEACRPPGAPGASPCSLALANMTGSNRLLIGIGWPLVLFVEWLRHQRLRRRFTELRLARPQSVEISYLAAATAYSLTLPLKASVTLLDAAVLIGIFVAYTVRVSAGPADTPRLLSPARELGALRRPLRLAVVAGLFLFSALVIVLCAEPFAEALVHTGKDLGVSEFLLVQWLAPLASEAPELLVAGMFAWRLDTRGGLGTLVSSKVNQWTLLVGTLPIVFAVSSGTLRGLPVDAVQREEVLLTASQSFFAVATLVSLSLSAGEALGLFALFWAQFLIGALSPPWARAAERVGVSAVYLLVGAGLLWRSRHRLGALLRDGFRTPAAELHLKVSP